MSRSPLFEVRDLEKKFRARGEGIISSLVGEQKYLRAVDDVSFDIEEGEILGIAGQSGCGKSTLGELLVRLQEPTGGNIYFDGDDVAKYGRESLKSFRQRCQIMFQDPYESLNPRFTVAQTVSEPLSIHDIGDREERDARVIEALDDAGLYPAEPYLNKIPSELSGGERQRVALARALVLDPDFLVADEPVSMLDVSVRTEVLHRFKELQRKRDLSMAYISHDLSTINYLADRTMIMFLGNPVEIGPTEEVIHDPSHPYSEKLLNSMLSSDPEREGATDRDPNERIQGDIPDPIDLPDGCRFNPWCPYSTAECEGVEPPLEEYTDGDEPNRREAACYHPVNK